MLHSWTSVKVYNFGVDVTSTISALTYVFKINNIYTASSNTGSSDGSWSTSGNTLTLDGGGWTIIELTSTSLKISQGDIIIHFQ
jgi:hypothetical protein